MEIKPIHVLHTYLAHRRFGPARGGHRGRRYGPKVPDPIEWDQYRKGVNEPYQFKCEPDMSIKSVAVSKRIAGYGVPGISGFSGLTGISRSLDG